MAHTIAVIDLEISRDLNAAIKINRLVLMMSGITINS